MKLVPGLLAALFVLFTMAGAAAGQEQDVLADQSAFRQNFADRTVFVQVRDSDGGPVLARGTGVLLASGFVLSSFHLVEDAAESAFDNGLGGKHITGIVGTNDDFAYRLSIVGEDRTNDLVLLRFNPGTAMNFGKACIAANPVRPGDRVGVLGFPAGLSLAVTVGTVSNEEATFITSDVAVTRGHSGSGVYDDAGRVVGIVKGGLKVSGASTPFAVIIPIAFARSLLSPVPLDDCSAPTTAASAELEVSYVRLSGGLEVPLFIQAQTWGGVAITSDRSIARLGVAAEGDGYDNFSGHDNTALRDSISVQGGMISPAIAEFWADSPYHDAMPIATPLWRQLADDGWLGHRLIAAADHSASDLYCALRLTVPYLLDDHARILSTQPIHIPDHTLEEIWGEAQVPGYVRAEVDGGARCDRAVTRKVGFLFLVLRNAGNIALTNINIQSLEFPPGSIDPSIWSIAESERIEHFEEMATNPAFAAFAGQIGAGEARSRNAPNLQPGQSFIWLISVYRTTPDFYEARYLSELDVPLKMTLRAEDRQESVSIRLPRRGNALPIAMPFGWYHQ